MKRLIKGIVGLAFIGLAASALSADLFVYWTNGTNNVSTVTNTFVYYGVAPGVYTNFVQVPITQTNVTITGLVGGQRYYAAAQHSDGVDRSLFSNEDNAKTKIHPPRNANVSTP